MKNKRNIHTTLEPYVYLHLKHISDTNECGVNDAIKYLVDKDKVSDEKLKQSVLDEIVERVIYKCKLNICTKIGD